MFPVVYPNKIRRNVTFTYSLYKIEDASLVLELKVIFNSRASKNVATVLEFDIFHINFVVRLCFSTI